MAQITSSIGLVSGINTGAIIDELMSLDQEPVTILQSEVSSSQAQQKAYSALETQLTSLQSIGMALERPTTFLASTATSSDPSTLTAITTAGAPSGTYQFQVAQLVTAQQSVSNGFTSTSTTLQPGTLTFEMGGGNLDTQTALANLNGGAGVSAGQFRITDRSGKTDVINTSGAVTLDDVVSKINTSLDISVQASIKDNHLVLTDTSGGTGTLKVTDLAGGSAAQDLGIAQSVNSDTLTGTSINSLSANTAVSSLNDGRGIRVGNGSGDFVINTADGTAVTVNVAGAQTVGDVLKAINSAGNGKVTASLAPGATGITLTDTTTGGGAFSVADINGSNAADDLGLTGTTGAGGTLTGKQILSGIDTVLLSSLNGGKGISLGQLSISHSTNPPTSTTVDLSGATTVQGVLDAINNSGAGVTASLNAAANGIQIQDTSGGTGGLVIGDADTSKTAENLGIAGTFAAGGTADSGDLHLQYVTQNTSLSTFNGGKGVGTGSFSITNSAGGTTNIDLSSGTFNTIGDVLNAINAKNIGVTASINSNGNGILLTDSSGGGGHLAVQSVSGTAAADLNIAGTATGNTIDGAEEKSIQVTSSDTLTTLQTKIQSLGFDVSASIINDGSSQAPYRLSLTSTNSGAAGRITIDAGTTGLQFRDLVKAQDAAVFVGGTGSAPLLVTSNTNQLTKIIPGVTVSLLSASTTPVTLSITRDGTSIATQLQTFTDTFNSLVDQINTYTQYDTSTNSAGLLLGDPTTQAIQSQMYQVFSAVASSAGTFRTLGDVGMTLTDGAKITFDANTFDAAFAANPDAVKNLFTDTSTGLGKVIDNSMTSLVDPFSGTITDETNTLTTKINDFNTQITQLDSILSDKRSMLETQFANMETTLATLQSQQSALSSFTGIKAPTSSSSSSSG
jgi:flagellar hook-associated protein 2